MYLLYAKSMGVRVGGSESRYIPTQGPKMELFHKIANCYFHKKLKSYVWNMFEMVLNMPLHHFKTNNLSSEKESGSYKNYYENFYDEDCFLVKVLARSENY